MNGYTYHNGPHSTDQKFHLLAWAKTYTRGDSGEMYLETPGNTKKRYKCAPKGGYQWKKA